MDIGQRLATSRDALEIEKGYKRRGKRLLIRTARETIDSFERKLVFT